jgi:glycosyltransferase involved in cell wall biosynthesis
MILLLHNRYRLPGGEERAVEDLAWLIREHLGEDAEVLERDSAALGNRRAVLGLLRGGLEPDDVAHAVRRTGARVVHAHNLTPSFGWRALAAARGAGARVVAHLHNYRLVCAQGLCFTHGADCTRCHGRDTRPGVRLNCRSGSRAEAAVYAAGIALHQRRLAEAADAFVVPSAFALARLRELGAPVGDKAHVIASVQRDIAEASSAATGRHVLAAGRLSPEKGFQDAIDAAALAGLPLVIAGDGPERAALEARAGAEVTFTGPLPPGELAELRARAGAAVVPSRFAEILPLAALEAMAAGVPLAAADAGGLTELVADEGRYPPGDVEALAERLRALWQNAEAGERALATAREKLAPQAVARRLKAVYGATSAPASS